MYQKWTQLALAIALVLALILIGFLVIRLSAAPAAAPTADLSMVQTQAVAAFAFDLTRAATSQPAATTTSTLQETPQNTQAPAGTAATQGTASVSATPSCYRLKFVDDISVEDYTIMTPAQVFTKAWKVENNGSCPWKPGFKLVLVGGTAMGGSPFVLGNSVNPGAQIEISIKMVAPTNQTGRVDGAWQMMDTTGQRFGDTLTVVIVIGGGTPGAPTATP